MAKTSNRTDTPKIKKQTPLKGAAGKAAKFSNEWLMPQNASDVAMLLFPYGKVAKGVGRAVKKVIKPASKTKKVTKLAEPKSNVRVKPAAKQVGNPPNSAKSLEKTASSFYRTWNPETGMEDGLRAAGKLRDARVANSKKPTAPGNAAIKPAPASVPARKPANPARATVKINSAKSVRVVKVAPRKKSATQLRPKKK
jgi:hypothetical protein